MRALFASAFALFACTTTSNEAPPPPTPKSTTTATSAEKPAEKAPRSERKMTDEAKATIDRLSDSQAPEPERIKAARRLAELEDPATVVPMMMMLEVELPEALADEIRKALVLMNAADVLIEDLKTADDQGRATAARLLGRTKDRAAIDPLTRALSDPAAKVRESAAASLGTLGATEAEAALIERLLTDPEPDVRGAAAQGLGALKTETAKAALQKALATEKDGFVKVLIEQGLR